MNDEQIAVSLYIERGIDLDHARDLVQFITEYFGPSNDNAPQNISQFLQNNLHVLESNGL
jgi:hypothetical protein